MNLASLLARNTAAEATSSTSPIRPIGTLKTNFSRFSGVSSTPVNCEKRPVLVTSGHMLTTRIWCGPSSAARPFVAFTSRQQRHHPPGSGTYVGNSSLGRVVPHQPRPRPCGSDTRNIDNHTSFVPINSLLGPSIAAKVNTLNIDVECLLELFLCHIDRRLILVACACVVHKHVLQLRCEVSVRP
jgi:hypothetical protein